ncbi:MAG TPA: hypothetical protein VFO39_00225 [Candidatus Sulfotelmatobacter sp.]|nr:hypothetical protein [Candidatus Sulfotelmatobacter sp.]
MKPSRSRIVAIFGTLTMLMIGVTLVSTNGTAQGKGHTTPPTFNVTSTIYDFADYPADTTLNLLRSDDKDGATTDLAVYSGGYVGTSVDEWRLGQLSAPRTAYVTFSSPAANSGPSPVPDGFYEATIFSRCFDQSLNDTGWLTIAVGQTANLCSLRVNVTYNNVNYTFVMSPEVAGTGWASVTCNAGNSTDGCTNWTVVPTPSTVTTVGNLTNNSTVGQLISIGKAGRQTTVGSYHNTFRILVTNP